MMYVQWHQPQGIYETNLFHDLFIQSWTPYWYGAFMTWVEGVQVTNDMRIWNNKRFSRKLHYRENVEADKYILNWRKWFSKYYEGTEERQKEVMGKFRDYSW